MSDGAGGKASRGGAKLAKTFVFGARRLCAGLVVTSVKFALGLQFLQLTDSPLHHSAELFDLL